MRAASNPYFRLLGLPVEIVENVVLCLPVPVVLKLRVVRGFHSNPDLGAHNQLSRLLAEPQNTKPCRHVSDHTVPRRTFRGFVGR